MHQRTLDDILNHNRRQTTLTPVRKVVLPQSQIYVIDTAIVRSTRDTTRHLYTFNAKAKRTLDSTQRLTGDLWGDSVVRHAHV